MSLPEAPVSSSEPLSPDFPRESPTPDFARLRLTPPPGPTGEEIDGECSGWVLERADGYISIG